MAVNASPPAGELHRLLGYGGFIHGLKNFVLRGNPETLTQAELDLEQAIALTEPYQDDINGQRLLVTLLAYQDMIARAREMHQQGASPTEIDRVIQVSDLDALKALNRWTNQVQADQQRAERQTWWLITATAISTLLCLLFMGSQFYFMRRSRALIRQARGSELANHHLDRTLMGLTDLSDTDGLGFFQLQGNQVKHSGTLARLLHSLQMPNTLDDLCGLLPQAGRSALVDAVTRARAFSTPQRIDIATPPSTLRISLEPVPGSDQLLGLIQRLAPVRRHELESAQKTTEQIASDRAGRIKRLTQGLRQAKEQLATLERAAHKDPLTDLFNRLGFSERLRAEVQRARRKGQTLGVLMVDVDHFKHINDTYGHAIGDQALITVAETLQRLVRSDGGDIVGRLGGDEFIVILADANAQHGNRTLKMAKTLLADEEIPHCPDKDVRIEISGGAMTLNPATDEPGEIIKLADAALYEAKGQKREQA